MSEKYEEIRRVNKNGQRELSGFRHNHCYTSPVYREKAAQINRRLAKEFGEHPAVILWHISNEYGGWCFCPLCAEAFRGWLRDRYGTLEKLNHEWWSHFWSHTYTAWEQIHPPFNHGETTLHALDLDWRRFVTHQTVDFMKAEIAAVREGGSKLPVTTNLMGFHDGLNYFKFAEHLDIVSWDSYPAWHDDSPDELGTPAAAAMSHDLMRSIKREPVLLMESTPSMVNWQAQSRPKHPGMHMLSSMQAIAHGSDSVQYFQWRKSRGSFEKFHGAVVDHDCRTEHRVFADVAELGKRMDALGKVAGTKMRPDVAVIYDWENMWAIDITRGVRNAGMHYYETVFEHYRAFWDMGINVDILDMEQDISGYKMVVAPMLYMYRAGFAAKLKSFADNGGVLVGTYWSGVVNESDLCFMGGRPGDGMAEVFGLYADEIDTLYDSQSNSMSYNGKTYKLTELCDIVRAEGAEVLAAYGADFYTGKPALTRNRFGKGTAYYLAAKAELPFLRTLYAEIAGELNLRPDIAAELPRGVTICKRRDENGGTFWFVQNYLNAEASVGLSRPLKNAESGESVTALTLPPYGVILLQE
jgi:beta-galactosidase